MIMQMREENPFEEVALAKEWIDAIETEKGGARDREVYPMIRTWIKKNGFQKVLEIGSGQGICSQYVEVDYVGVEPSQTLIDRANHLYPDKKFIKGSSYDLPLEDESQDAAFSVGVWFHIENLDDAHKELARVLKPNGKVLIITSNPDTHEDWASLFTGTREGKKLDGEVRLPTGKMTRNLFFLHSQEEIVNSLEMAGFRIEKINKFGFGSENVKDRGLGFWMAIEANRI